jgi:hypothetical protein
MPTDALTSERVMEHRPSFDDAMMLQRTTCYGWLRSLAL